MIQFAVAAISRYAMPALVAGVVLSGIVAGVQTVRLGNARATLAETVATHARAIAEHQRVAREAAASRAALQAEHAAAQQQKDEDYAKRIAALDGARRVDAAAAGRLRDKLAAYTSGRGRAGETDATACERARDRLPVVGGLLAEGVELEAESRAVILRRDAEVTRLLEQIQADRKACGG